MFIKNIYYKQMLISIYFGQREYFDSNFFSSVSFFPEYWPKWGYDRLIYVFRELTNRLIVRSCVRVNIVLELCLYTYFTVLVNKMIIFI